MCKEWVRPSAPADGRGNLGQPNLSVTGPAYGVDVSLFAVLTDPSCVLCGTRRGEASTGDGGLCVDCLGHIERPPVIGPHEALEAVHALTVYRRTGRDLVTALKFRDQRVLVPWLARRMAALVAADGVDVVSWAPTAPRRRRKRGFDQAEVLAVRIGRELGVPCRRCLVRLPGPPQTGRHRSERLTGPSFDGSRGVVGTVSGRHVVVVDDVTTTGATLTRAATLLRAYGAGRVSGLVIAATPPG